MSCGQLPSNDRGVYHGVDMCDTCKQVDIADMLQPCSECSEFFFNCRGKKDASIVDGCHPNALLFVDGACINNGSSSAVAGVGIAIGTDKKAQFSLPVNDRMDNFPKRSNQRAELLAAIFGLGALLKKAARLEDYDDATELTQWVVAADSEYIVKGITEWVPRWKQSDWRRPDGKPPINLDLFRRLDEIVEDLENKCGVWVVFWHIPREYNKLADGLAKAAAASPEATTASAV